MKILIIVFHRIYPAIRLLTAPGLRGFSIYKVLFSVHFCLSNKVVLDKKKNGQERLLHKDFESILGWFGFMYDGLKQKNRATFTLATRSLMLLLSFQSPVNGDNFKGAEVFLLGQRGLNY